VFLALAALLMTSVQAPVTATQSPPTAQCASGDGRPLGCPVVENFWFIYFDKDSETLSGEARAVLAQVLAALPNNPRLTVHIGGHADALENLAASPSLRRVEAVRRYLIDRGVSADAIQMESYGARRPAVDFDDGSHGAMNRRVEINLSVRQAMTDCGLGTQVPAGLPCPVRDFLWLVYFDRNNAALTREARATLDELVDASREYPIPPLTLDAHADSSERAPEALSRHRAEAIRSYLLARGLAASKFSIRARGATRPAVETPRGRPEPQNRRVEIVYLPNEQP
jgi:outer membrane protein OmpA-like peptidoglycan-associated protein